MSAEVVDNDPLNPGNNGKLKDDALNEEKVLGSRPPFKTLLSLTIGPFTAQLILALYGLCDSLWVTYTLKVDGADVYGILFTVQFLIDAVAQWLTSGISARSSYLIGIKQSSEITDLYIDFFRISFIFQCIIPFIILPATKPVMRWFQAPENVVTMGFQYMTSPSVGCFFNFIYLVGCGLLQSQGKSLQYSIYQVITFVLNIFIFDPLFLLVFKWGMWGVGLANILSKAIPGVVLNVYIWKGKLLARPKLKMLLNKFHPGTKQALILGSSALVSTLSVTAPQMILQKYYASAAYKKGVYKELIMIWGVVERVYWINGCVDVGVAQALLPSASYAFGAGRYSRVLRLTIHAFWSSFLVTLIVTIILCSIPRLIASLWSRDETYLYWAAKIFPIVFYTESLVSAQYVLPVFLQSLTKAKLAAAFNFASLLIPLPIISTILHYINPDDPVFLMWTYVINSIIGTILVVVFGWIPFKELLSRIRDQDIPRTISLADIQTCGSIGSIKDELNP